MEETISNLEQRIGELIALSEALSRENDILQKDHRRLQSEFASLQEKNRAAHGRIDQIVSRLKAMQA